MTSSLYPPKNLCDLPQNFLMALFLELKSHIKNTTITTLITNSIEKKKALIFDKITLSYPADFAVAK